MEIDASVREIFLDFTEGNNWNNLSRILGLSTFSNSNAQVYVNNSIFFASESGDGTCTIASLYKKPYSGIVDEVEGQKIVSNISDLLSKLKSEVLLNPFVTITFSDVPNEYIPLVRRALLSVGRVVSMDEPCHLWRLETNLEEYDLAPHYSYDVDMKQLGESLGLDSNTYVLDLLYEEDSFAVDATWKYRVEGKTCKQIANDINSLPGVCIREVSTNAPVSWVMLRPDFSIATMYTHDSHRGKGLAKIASRALILLLTLVRRALLSSDFASLSTSGSPRSVKQKIMKTVENIMRLPPVEYYINSQADLLNGKPSSLLRSTKQRGIDLLEIVENLRAFCHIRMDNVASQKVFRSLGFKQLRASSWLISRALAPRIQLRPIDLSYFEENVEFSDQKFSGASTSIFSNFSNSHGAGASAAATDTTEKGRIPTELQDLLELVNSSYRVNDAFWVDQVRTSIPNLLEMMQTGVFYVGYAWDANKLAQLMESSNRFTNSEVSLNNVGISGHAVNDATGLPCSQWTTNGLIEKPFPLSSESSTSIDIFTETLKLDGNSLLDENGCIVPEKIEHLVRMNANLSPSLLESDSQFEEQKCDPFSFLTYPLSVNSKITRMRSKVESRRLLTAVYVEVSPSGTKEFPFVSSTVFSSADHAFNRFYRLRNAALILPEEVCLASSRTSTEDEESGNSVPITLDTPREYVDDSPLSRDVSVSPTSDRDTPSFTSNNRVYPFPDDIPDTVLFSDLGDSSKTSSRDSILGNPRSTGSWVGSKGYCLFKDTLSVALTEENSGVHNIFDEVENVRNFRLSRLSLLTVSPEALRVGTGMRTLAFAEVQSRFQHKAKVVEATVVAVKPWLLRFYQNAGYVAIGRSRWPRFMDHELISPCFFHVTRKLL